MNIKLTLTALLACTTLGCGTPQRTAALECGAGGAGAAFLLCKAFGGSDDSCAGMAAVGGGVGAAACYNYADELEESREELAREEDTLDARLKYTDNLIADTEAANAQMHERLAELERYTQELQTKVAQNALSEKQLRDARTALEQENRQASEQLAQARAALAENQRYLAQQEQAFRAEQAQREQDERDAQAAKLKQLTTMNAQLEAAVHDMESSAQQFAGLSALV